MTHKILQHHGTVIKCCYDLGPWEVWGWYILWQHGSFLNLAKKLRTGTSIISVNGSLQDFTLVGVSPFGITGFAINILILFVGVGTGVLLLSDNSDRAIEYYDKYYALVEKHEKLKGQRDELRLDAVRNFDKIFQELKRLKNEKG